MSEFDLGMPLADGIRDLCANVAAAMRAAEDRAFLYGDAGVKTCDGCGRRDGWVVFPKTSSTLCARCARDYLAARGGAVPVPRAAPTLPERPQSPAMERAAALVEGVREILAEAQEIRDAETPEVPATCVGWRAWKFGVGESDGYLLSGTGMGGAWAPGVNRAFHGTEPAPCDNADCHCGFNVYARPEYLASHPGVRYGGARVFGAVEAGGPRFMLNAGVGFRAETARVVVLALDGGVARRGAIRAIADELGASTCKPEHLPDAALEFGDPLPDDLLGWSAGISEWEPSDPDRREAFAELARREREAKAALDEFLSALVDGSGVSLADARRALGIDW